MFYSIIAFFMQHISLISNWYLKFYERLNSLMLRPKETLEATFNDKTSTRLTVKDIFLHLKTGRYGEYVCTH